MGFRAAHMCVVHQLFYFAGVRCGFEPIKFVSHHTDSCTCILNVFRECPQNVNLPISLFCLWSRPKHGNITNSFIFFLST